MPFELIEEDEKPMELTESHIERILRYLSENNETQKRLIEVMNRHCGILQNCELHLNAISAGVLAAANMTQETLPGHIPPDLEQAMQHAATLRDRATYRPDRRRKP